MRNFDYLFTQLGELVNMDKTDSTDLTNLKRFTNEALQDFQNKFQWKWKEKTGFTQTVKNVTAGSVTVTKDSRSVSGSGTAWASTDVGKYFRVNGTLDFYEIIAVGSATSLTLRRTYVRDTQVGANYLIYKKYYTLVPDVDELIDIYKDEALRLLMMETPREAPIVFNGWDAGVPWKFRKYDIDRSVTTYSTGTVSGTIDTRTLTGSTTAWLDDNAQPGDLVTIGANTYNILTVDSALQITLVQNQLATTSGSSYTLTRSNLKRIEFNATPNDFNRNITYTYYQRTYDLKNDNDEAELPDIYIPVVLMKAKSLAYAHLDDTRESTELASYEALVRDSITKESSKRNQPQRMRWFGEPHVHLGFFE